MDSNTITEQPSITEPPSDTVIRIGEGQLNIANFKCVAIGRPIPEIEWFYITINPDGSLGIPEQLLDERYTILNSDNAEDPAGRLQRTNILTITVTETDPGGGLSGARLVMTLKMHVLLS